MCAVVCCNVRRCLGRATKGIRNSCRQDSTPKISRDIRRGVDRTKAADAHGGLGMETGIRAVAILVIEYTYASRYISTRQTHVGSRGADQWFIRWLPRVPAAPRTPPVSYRTNHVQARPCPSPHSATYPPSNEFHCYDQYPSLGKTNRTITLPQTQPEREGARPAPALGSHYGTGKGKEENPYMGPK